METHIWSLLLTAIGILGFWLAGQKVWWTIDRKKPEQKGI